MLVMKCLEREEDGYLPLKDVKGVLESQIKTEAAKQEIRTEVQKAEVKKKRQQIGSGSKRSSHGAGYMRTQMKKVEKCLTILCPAWYFNTGIAAEDSRCR